ncbi:MAG TPA: PilZ domain-containing protein [Terriglobales bacterium]|nr:PilZ domain-containing protein [Terriglobales bacterium]
MAAQSLVLCNDPQIVDVLRPLLDRLGLSAEVCTAREQAESLLGARKYNPVIVDCEQRDDASQILRSLRASDTNRDTIALGLIEDSAHLRDAFSMGANLVLRKPIIPDEAERILRTASSLVTRMRRRFLRHVIHTLAYAHIEGINDVLMLNDVGEGGIAVQGLEPLEERHSYSLRFTLPHSEQEFHAVAAVAWTDSSARAGLRFLGMSPASREALQQWLAAHGTLGPAEAPDTAPEVHFPLQISPLAERAFAAVLDLSIVIAAVILFGAIAMLFVQQFPPADWTGAAVLFIGCGCWMIYRHAFFGGVANTPGAYLARTLAETYLTWQDRDPLVLVD